MPTNYSVTSANVVASANATFVYGFAGEAITRGQAVYQVPVGGTWKKADADGALPLPNMAGVVMSDAATGQPIIICTDDPNFKPGFTLAIGEVAILSSTAGAFCLFSDYATGWYMVVALVGLGSGNARLKIIRADLPKP
jgi:hypothetical protein